MGDCNQTEEEQGIFEETANKEGESITFFDIYDDLDDVNIPAEYEKLKHLNEDLLKHTKKLEADLAKVTEELTEMKTKQETLKVNISELFNTAKTEIERKNRTIAELRQKVDDFVFRRNDKWNLPDNKLQENKEIKVVENEKKRPHSPPRVRKSRNSRSKSPKRRRSNSHDRYKSRSNRHSPNRTSRKSPNRRSPRRSPVRKSPGRRSPNRKSPSRRSPNRRSLHSKSRDSRRSQDQFRRDDRYNERNLESSEKNRINACRLDKTERVEYINKSVNIQEGCDKKVDTKVDGVHNCSERKLDLDNGKQLRGNLDVTGVENVETKPVVTIISDIVVKSHMCLETAGKVNTEEAFVKTDEDMKAKAREENNGRMDENNTCKEGNVGESVSNGNSLTDNTQQGVQGKLIEPTQPVIASAPPAPPLKRRRRCVVKSIA